MRKNEPEAARKPAREIIEDLAKRRREMEISPALRAALRASEPAMPELITGEDLAAFQGRRTAMKDAVAQKNAVLATLLRAHHAASSDPESYELLLVAMLPLIRSFYWARVARSRAGKNDDRSFGALGWADESWSVVISAFAAAVEVCPHEPIPTSVAAKLMGLMFVEIRKERTRLKNVELGRDCDIALDASSDEDPINEGAHPSPPDDGGIPTLGGEVPAAFTKEEIASACARLGALLPSLREVDRWIVVGQLVEDRSIAAIAKEHGLSEAATTSRFRRAMEQLRKKTRSASAKRDQISERKVLIKVEGEREMNDAAATTGRTISASSAEPDASALSKALPVGWKSHVVPGQFRASLAAIKCPRALYFRLKSDPRAAVLNGRSPLVERIIDSALENREWRANAVMDLNHGGLHVRGSADLVRIGADDQPLMAVLIHELAPHEWSESRYGVREEHRAVANLIATGLKAPRWSVFYVEEGTGEIVEHVAVTTSVLAGWALENFKKVAEALKRGVPPACPVEHRNNPNGQPCKCRWNKVVA
jgi:DNA-directed RNA polymerase specialized sigma24 family protein